ncbi:MAG: hypothetical protein KJ077_27335 [Anaerolineae bacterium]|nr:hypothetical protein [Anaerolineae bacterium]
MTRTLMTHTQIAVVLSLNIITVSDTGPQIIPLPLVSLTPILLALWSFWQWLDGLVVAAARVAARAVFSLESAWMGLTLSLTLALILAWAIGWACQKPLSKTLMKNSGSAFWAIQRGI